MPRWILFGLASPRPGFNPQTGSRALESNIRFCDFFVQIFGETEPHAAFREFVELAIACTADPAFPMRSTVVVFRNPENACPEMASLRRDLIQNARCEVRDFHNPEDFERVSEEILTNWFAMVQDKRDTIEPA